MKKKINNTILILFLSSLIPSTPIFQRMEHIEVITPKVKLIKPEVAVVTLRKPNNLFQFLTDLGFRESSNRYNITNKFGYLGKYQFGKATLRGLGYNISPQHFLNNPTLQEEAMLKLLKHNKKKLQKYINKYQNKTVNGIFITESGILAAAHLGGIRNVKRWFRGVRFKDGLGTSLSTYMYKFSGYNLNLIV